MLYNDRFIATSFMINNDKDTGLADAVMGFGQTVSLLGITIAVLLLAYYATKFLAKSRLASTKSSNMRVLESMSLGFQNVLYLVQVGEKYFVVSASKDRVSFLSEINPDTLDFSESETKKQIPPFESVLSNFIEKHVKKGKSDE